MTDRRLGVKILRRASQRQNVKLRDLAHTIVANTAHSTERSAPRDPAKPDGDPFDISQ